MIQNNNKGFTLIELLVVVAIIGILASVVLASLSGAESKGKDAAIKSGLASAISQAEIEADGVSGGYTTACTNIGAAGDVLNNISINIGKNGGTLTCTADANGNKSIEFNSPLDSNSSTIWCVDNNGWAGTPTGTIGVGTCGE